VVVQEHMAHDSEHDEAYEAKRSAAQRHHASAGTSRLKWTKRMQMSIARGPDIVEHPNICMSVCVI
jgi:hypothetical protein